MASSTNKTSLAYDKETVYGTTDASPTFQLLPTTGGSPVNNISTAVSEVIRDDRQTDDLIVVDGDISGEMNYELSYAPYEDFLASVLLADAAARSFALTTATTTSDENVAKTGIGTSVEAGDVIRLTSASEPTINGEYAVLTSSANAITVYPDVAASASDVSVDADSILVNGNEPVQSHGYTIRKTALGGALGATPYYWYYKGCIINTMNFNFATGSILNGSVGVVGLTELASTSKLAGETADTVIPAYSILNSVNSVGVINITGVTLGLCSFSSLDLTIDNQVNTAKAIGTLGACDTTAYSVQITGNTEVYFNNLDLYTKFLASDSFSITIILTDGDGNTIGINMPKCKFESLDTPISGKDAFLMQSGSFKALRDATLDYMIKITRIDA